MDDCIFCKIIKGDIPAETIFENDEFKVILDAFPANKGHVLVVPKNHVGNIFEIDEEQAGRLFALATRVARSLETQEFTESLNVLQNNGELAGQTVHHFHMHLIPRFKGDNVTLSWKTCSYEEGEAARIRDNIIENL